MLREYQQRAITRLYEWFEAHDAGHPCLVMPTGSGKSHVIAALCKDALQSWPETRVLMLTHVKELIAQNAEKMRLHWPGAPMGIYSAGIGQRVLSEPITFAGIQSVRNKSRQIGHIDLVLVDECHMISHKQQGGYRQLLDDLSAINPALRVIGLTATPYRLGHGMITDAPAIFSETIEPVTIAELVHKGYLSTLQSKHTGTTLDVSGVKKRGGEYVESELQAAVNTDANNRPVVDEIIARAGERKAWLVFCSGVAHAEAVAAELAARGIAAACVTGETPKNTRDRLLAEFKAGKLRALTNANVLTTGFDYPDVDLIALLRPTMSPGLYVQMAGRGLRVKSHTDHCLVLDFAGCVRTHGPITAVQPPGKAGTGEAPTKTCQSCGEIVHAAAAVCPACGAAFPRPERKEEKTLRLHDDDIMGLRPRSMAVTSWRWLTAVSRASGKSMLKCTYYGELSDPPVTEYLTVLHDGYAGQKAMATLARIATSSGANLAPDDETLPDIAKRLDDARPPDLIEYRMDGKFHRVLSRQWEYEKEITP